MGSCVHVLLSNVVINVVVVVVVVVLLLSLQVGVLLRNYDVIVST